MEKYPLIFAPIFKYRIWGGNKLGPLLHKNIEGDKIGESWEISAIPQDETLVINGCYTSYSLRNLIAQFKGDFLGNAVHQKFGEAFPLLVKYIDTKQPLSIQVHPDDKIALERHQSLGKTEMWYILEACEAAEITIGFKQTSSPDSYQKHLKNKSLGEILNIEKVNDGDAYYVPAGRVHAIGSGVVLAEIQQSSDVTYRLYDYDRIDDQTGSCRPLHNELAINIIDFSSESSYKTNYNLQVNAASKLIHTPYFTTNVIQLKGQYTLDYHFIDSFVILMVVKGHVILTHQSTIYDLKLGQTVLLPAKMNKAKLQSKDAIVLEVYI